jgi:hypothetical protein
MKNKMKITKNELIQILLNWSYGAQPAAIQYISEPKLTKEGKINFGTITKIANVGVILGFIYENAVNRERKKEGLDSNFESKELWAGKGKHINNLLITHIEKGTYYLSYKYQQTFKSLHLDKNLNIIPNEVLKPYFPEKTENKSQGIENEVPIRIINIDNIRKLKFRKTTYEIVK